MYLPGYASTRATASTREPGNPEPRGYRATQIPGFLATLVSENLATRISGQPATRASGDLAIRVLGYAGTEIARYLSIRVWRYRAIRVPRNPGAGAHEYPGTRISADPIPGDLATRVLKFEVAPADLRMGRTMRSDRPWRHASRS